MRQRDRETERQRDSDREREKQRHRHRHRQRTRLGYACQKSSRASRKEPGHTAQGDLALTHAYIRHACQKSPINPLKGPCETEKRPTDIVIPQLPAFVHQAGRSGGGRVKSAPVTRTKAPWATLRVRRAQTKAQTCWLTLNSGSPKRTAFVSLAPRGETGCVCVCGCLRVWVGVRVRYQGRIKSLTLNPELNLTR